MLTITNCKKEQVNGQDYHNFYFSDGSWVGLTPSEGLWEFMEDDDDDEDSYISGGYQVDGGCVVDYDGCFQLPVHVVKAFRKMNLKVDSIIVETCKS